MRAVVVGLALLGLVAPSLASAQVVQRCKGERFAELAAARLGDARLGPLLGRFNGQEGESCKKGRFVRFPAAIPHEVRLGQTISAIAARFTRGPGGEALLRERNGLPPGTEPAPGAVLEVPSEMTLKLGTRPEQEVAALFGLPPIAEIRAYNGVKQLPKGGTIYVPLFFDLLPASGGRATAPPPPPPPPPPAGGSSTDEPEKVVDPASAADADPRVAPTRTSTTRASMRVLRVAAVARFDGFRHPIHEAVLQDSWQCEACHVDDPRRPHAYLPVPETLCTECHSGAERTDPVLRTYRLALSYSHDQHLSAEREARAKGYEMGCDTCHPASADSGQRGEPGHAVCIQCHNPSEVAPRVESECSGCHAQAESMDRRLMAKALLAEHYRRSEREDDIVFGHEEHVALFDQGSEASCDRCHVRARTADTLAQIEPQRMSDCLTCHQGLKRELAGAAVRLDRCRTCHLSTRAEIAPVFGAVLDKPLSHSRTFRTRHRRQAEADDGVCAACHTELAGGSGRNCSACHQQILPQDHTVRWREAPHGRAAVRHPDRCATCHLEDRCADCHAQPPRDHFPRATFQLRHGRRARVSTRRCLTCHIPQVDCARCHDVGAL